MSAASDRSSLMASLSEQRTPPSSDAAPAPEEVPGGLGKPAGVILATVCTTYLLGPMIGAIPIMAVYVAPRVLPDAITDAVSARVTGLRANLSKLGARMRDQVTRVTGMVQPSRPSGPKK